ncbi:MAG: Calx-beta domain-containing protein [Bacteroidota bacterium]
MTLTVEDNNSNTSTCTATVTVEDNVDPVATCQNITVQLDATGNATITTGDINNGSNDACGIASLSLDDTAFDCTEVGANTVTLTVEDNNSNTSTCSATVTVEDNVDPVATCQNITVQLDATGNATITTGDINNGSSDACGIASLSLNETAFDCTEVGANTVTLTVEDNNSNTSTCTATVTVEDNVDPVATCQNITVQLDATGNASITTGDINNGSSDACGIASLSLNETAFDCTEVGANTVTLTVEDNNSNTSTCTATVTVEDNVDPQISCSSNITVNNDIGICGAVVTFTTPVGTDNCAGSNTVQTSGLASGATFPFGTTTNCFEVTDASGNTASCCFDVTVNDIQPTISISDETEDESVGNMIFTVSLSTIYCQDITINYNTNGLLATDPNDFTGVTTGTLTIPAGDSTGTISIAIIDDNIDEGTEDFELNLTSSTLGSFTDNQGIGTIDDNDNAPQISISDVSVLENAGTVDVTISLSNPSAVDIDLDVSTLDVEAVDPFDYDEITTTTETIAAGATSLTITLTINDDLLDEIDETFEVNLSNPVNATITDGKAIVTILDDDGAPTLFIVDETYNEGDGSVTFTVGLSSPSGQTVLFDFGQTGITATQGLDYSIFNGTNVSILPGNTTRTISFSIIDDVCNEFDETFEINLTNPVNATISDGLGEYTILDNDPTPEVCVSDASFDESAGTVLVEFTLSSYSCLPVTVNYSSSDISATAGADYSAVVAGTQVIPADTLIFEAVIPITIQEDALDEIDETFDVSIDSATNAIVGACSGTFTIQDNDATPCLSIDDPSVDEANGTITFTVSLDAISGQQVGFSYSLNDIGTTAGSDFTDPGLVTSFIAEGDIDTTIVITITDDLLDEIDETFEVNLSAPSNATICDGQGIGTIQDNDATPCLSIVSDQVINENAGTVTFDVQLDAPSGQPVAVDYVLNNIEALNPDDYSENSPIAPQTLNFPEGNTLQTVTVTVSEDLLNEIDETFEIVILNPVAANLCLGGDTAIATITDNDTPPCFSVDDISFDESTGTADFTISLNAPSGQPVSVDYALSDISTNSGPTLDYTNTTGTLNFATGVTSMIVSVTINDDLLDEIDEQFQITLSNNLNADICDGTGIATIQDNDATPCLSIDDVVVDEADGSATFTISLDAESGQSVSVDFDLLDISTNTLAIDLVDTAGTFIIPEETLSLPLSITINEDLLDEIDETYEIVLSNSINSTICDAQGLGTIQDNDATPCIGISDVTEDESNGNITFTVSLDALSGQDVFFDWNTGDITALDSNNDYDTAGQLGSIINEGDLSTNLVITINEDLLDEIDETFNVTLSNPVNSSLCPGNETATGTILDNDVTPCLSVSDALHDENDPDGTVDFTVSLDAPSGQDVTFTYYTVQGSAIEAIDFIADSAAILIPEGVTDTVISISIIDDALFEHNESFNLLIHDPINALICDDTGLGIIDSEDALPIICVNDTTVNEDDGIATLTYTLNVPSGEDTEIINADLGGGDAINGLDLNFIPDTFIIAAGGTSIQIDVPIIDDLLDENAEIFQTHISSVSNAQILGSCATGEITIVDNDLPPVICIDDLSIDESGSATLNVWLDAVSGLDVNFDWSTNDITAQGGLDYQIFINEPALIPAGTDSITINIPFIEDNIDEADETFEVLLTNISNATLGLDCIGDVIIEDNDQTPEICIDNVTVDEADGTATLTISLTNPSSSDISLDINTASNTATQNEDFGIVAINDTIIPALSTSIQVVIPILEDLYYETTEQVNVLLSDAVNAVIDCSLGQILITDNEAVPCLSISDISINETSQIAEFEVCTDIASEIPLTFEYTTNDLSAEEGLDYLGAVSLPAQIIPFDTCTTLSITVIDDNLLEFTEQFELILSNSTSSNICTGTAIATINDDKDPSFVSFDVDSTTYDESAGTISVVVLNSQPNVQEIKVPIILTGTAVNGDDYTILTDTVTFAPAEDSHNFEISIIDDIIYDIDEDIILTFDIPNMQNAFPGSITQHVLSIVDNDCEEDDDNDGIENCDELGDCNDNGIPDYIDFYDPNGDEDGDGVPNLFEDADGDGNPCNDDFDGDGTPNWVDLDSDADGYSDEMEELNDDDNDGQYDFLDPFDPTGDNDNDCVLNGDEDPDGDGDPYNDDTDNDGIPNLNDPDDDNDNILSCDEDCGSGADIATLDTDGDGVPNYLDEDSDDDTILDIIEGIIDFDGDGIPNVCDLDSDDDGLPDELEGSEDVDNDGNGNYIDNDSDSDGVTDYIDGIDDCDGDLIMNFLDSDICDLIIPPAFSPNGDNIRDAWEIYPIDAYPQNSVEIYTRWGQKIYQASPYQNDWVGDGPHGDLPTGTYYYILNLGDGSDIITGYVYINRSR